MENVERVLIVGSGCAGLTAAIYAARANLSPLVMVGSQPGGQLTTTNGVENFPGFPEGVGGFELTASMRAQAERFGARFTDDSVEKVDFEGDVKRIVGREKAYLAEAVIIATGANQRALGVRGESEFFGGKGVSVCATCDGAFYKAKEVAVVGGGDTACEEALFLTNFCSKIYLIHRRDTLRASQLLRQRVLAHGKIVPIWNSVVEEICGREKVSAIRIKNVLNNAEKKLQCTAVFVAVGHIPNTKPFSGNLRMDEGGYLQCRDGSLAETHVPGVFVAGDCADRVYRQAITAAGMGAMAAILAEKYISERERTRTIK